MTAAALPDEVATWCAASLGSAVDALIFETGHLGRVYGVELADGRRLAVKTRPAAARIAACVAVQQHLFAVGFPCPQPVAGPSQIGAQIVTAELFVGRAAPIAPTAQTLPRLAELLCRLVRMAPSPRSCGSLSPPPPWAGWDHCEPGIWPVPDDIDCNLNLLSGPAWIDEIGRRARACLRAADLPAVIGHLDWEAHNLAWQDGKLAAVLDWDSVAARPEAAIAGAAAAVFASLGRVVAASVGQSEQFLAAYEAARGRSFSVRERHVSWAAGAWVLAYNARKESATGPRGPYQEQLAADGAERLVRAAA
jgi:hypothetical protein